MLTLGAVGSARHDLGEIIRAINSGSESPTERPNRRASLQRLVVVCLVQRQLANNSHSRVWPRTLLARLDAAAFVVAGERARHLRVRSTCASLPPGVHVCSRTSDARNLLPASDSNSGRPNCTLPQATWWRLELDHSKCRAPSERLRAAESHGALRSPAADSPSRASSMLRSPTPPLGPIPHMVRESSADCVGRADAGGVSAREREQRRREQTTLTTKAKPVAQRKAQLSDSAQFAFSTSSGRRRRRRFERLQLCQLAGLRAHSASEPARHPRPSSSPSRSANALPRTQ